MQKYSFRECTLKLLEELFGLRRIFSSATLDQWIAADAQQLTELETGMLYHLQGLLRENVEAWNEQELALNFIGPLFSLVNFSEPYRFNLFAERKIGAVIAGLHDDIDLSGEPDGIVATGYWEPQKPFFAFQEYKRLMDPNGDPAGQAVAAMLVGQSMDEQPKPLYGCYVMGNAWRFVLLEKKQYAISQDFSAITDEIFDIFRILKALKQIVIELTV